MKTVIVTERTSKRLAQNNALVNTLKIYELKGKLDCKQARTTYEHYLNLQGKLSKSLPYDCYEHFDSKMPEEEPLEIKSCEICGFPVTSLLTKHHVIPQCKGGKDKDNIVMLCPTCHCAIHRSIDRGEIDFGIINYLGGIEGAVEKFGMYVRVCVEA